ncbi:hypothetical protein V6N13_069310 [Hibiscus sabdariffa]
MGEGTRGSVFGPNVHPLSPPAVPEASPLLPASFRRFREFNELIFETQKLILKISFCLSREILSSIVSASAFSAISDFLFTILSPDAYPSPPTPPVPDEALYCQVSDRPGD